jgi:mono/diheme cytochrome c family protein
MKHGVAPNGTYLYPAFPYPSYQRMTYEDLIDLRAYLDTLPAVNNKVPPPKLRFPYNIRRALGLWDRLYVDGKSFTPDPNASVKINRGAYLVQGPGHCSQCHSSRNLVGGIVEDTEFAGATGLEGKGHVPNITPSEDGIGDWRGGHRLSARDRNQARLRHDRRGHGPGTEEHGEAHARGPRSHRRLYQVAAAPARRRP